MGAAAELRGRGRKTAMSSRGETRNWSPRPGRNVRCNLLARVDASPANAGRRRNLGISDPVPATERDLYWEWVRAEVDVPANGTRSARLARHGLDARMLSILKEGDQGALLAPDWDALQAAFRRLRADYLDPLLDGTTAWRYGEFPLADLAGVRIPNLTISLLPLAPSRRLGEYAAALDAGRETPGLPNLSVYREMRGGFEPSRSRGCPVLISERVEGPYVVAEGLTRATVLVSWQREGRVVPPSLRVLVGTSARAREWKWW